MPISTKTITPRFAVAAQANGLHYVYLPVVSSAITPEQALAQADR